LLMLDSDLGVGEVTGLKWQEHQAWGTYYRALEHIITTPEGQPLSTFYAQLLLLSSFVSTFLPIRILPVTPLEEE